MAFSIRDVVAESSSIIGSKSDGRVEVRVYSFETASSIDYYPYNPDTKGYVWAWVDFSIKNVGTEEVSTNVLYAYLKDDQNYQYEARPTANAPKQLKLMKLPSGETLRGEIYFEIPAEAKIASFVWYDYASYINVPEFPSLLILSALLIIMPLIAVAYKTRMTYSNRTYSKT